MHAALQSNDSYSLSTIETSYPNVKEHVVLEKTFFKTPVTWTLPCTQLVGCPSRNTSMRKNVACHKRKHNPLVWCWRGLITFVDLLIRFKRGAVSLSPWRYEGNIKKHRACHLTSILPIPLLLLSSMESGIMTLTGTLYRKVVITQIWWKSLKYSHPCDG